MIWCYIAAVVSWIAIELIAAFIIKRNLGSSEPDDEKEDINFVCVVKGSERYVFLYADTPENRRTIVKTAIRWAADRDLSFTYRDASKVEEHVGALEVKHAVR